MAFYIRQVFGDKLYTEVINPDAPHLPSPEDLRKKIIIKVFSSFLWSPLAISFASS
jgi:Phosphatidylinositol-specific phospholipase C, X domain